MSLAHQRAAETEPILKLLWGSRAVTMRWSVPYLQTLRQHNQPVFWGLHNLSYCGNEIVVQKLTLKELKTYFFSEFHRSIPDEGNDWELCSKNAEESVCRGRKFIEFRKTFHWVLAGDSLNSLSLWWQETGEGCWSVSLKNSHARGKNWLIKKRRLAIRGTSQCEMTLKQNCLKKVPFVT